MTGAVEKKSLILLACRTPRRFTELMREARVSRAWLAEALKELVEEGLLEKLPDDRYVLSDKGKMVAETVEAETLLAEAAERGVVAALKTEIERLFTVEAVVKVLRAWAVTTMAWKWVCKPDAKASDEEKRAVMLLEAYLKLLGGETWWRRYSLLLPSEVVERMNDIYEAGRNPIYALVGTKGNIIIAAKEPLGSIPARGVEKLPNEVRSALLLLARLAEERLKELEDKSILEKFGRFLQAGIMMFGVKRRTGDEEVDSLTLYMEKLLEDYLS
jgi:DNA-binding HxlR family transcriptional regulator